MSNTALRQVERLREPHGEQRFAHELPAAGWQKLSALRVRGGWPSQGRRHAGGAHALRGPELQQLHRS